MDHDFPTARRAVAALFVLNAVTFGNVVPRLPAIKLDLGLSNTALGTAVAAMSVGGLLSGAAAGWLIKRFGSRRVAVTAALGAGAVLPFFAVAPSWGVLAAVFLVAGAFDSVMDASMNAHALRVQRGLGRSIINGLHGMWSVGAVLGGAMGTVAAAAGVSLRVHLLVAGALVVLVASVVRSRLLSGDDEADRRPADPDDAGMAPRRRAVGSMLAWLGVLVVLSAVVEDAPLSWAAVFLRTELGTSAAVAGLAYISFQACMTVARLLGDRMVDRVGPAAVARGGGVLIAAAMSAGLVIAHPAAVIVAFGLAGLGTASLFPLVFHAAGNIEGLPTGHGVSVVSWIARVGFFLAPPLVGAIGDAANLRVGLAVVPLAGVAVAMLAGVLNRPGANSHRPHAAMRPRPAPEPGGL